MSASNVDQESGSVTERAPVAVIRPLEPEELNEAGRVLARSHQSDPAFSWIYPDPARRAKALAPLLTQWTRDALPHGGVYVAASDSAILGVFVTLPPGCFPLTLWRKIRIGSRYLPILTAAPRSFRALLSYQDEAERHHPEEESWYMEILGIDDGLRGLGLGTRLIEHVLALADEQGAVSFCETAVERNVVHYERLGFQVTNPAVPLVKGGPTHWHMERPARLHGAQP